MYRHSCFTTCPVKEKEKSYDVQFIVSHDHVSSLNSALFDIVCSSTGDGAVSEPKQGKKDLSGLHPVYSFRQPRGFFPESDREVMYL